MKRAISAKGTYVLDADELDQLGELSLTTVIADLADSVEPAQQEPKLSLSEPAAATTQTDHTINELLAGEFWASDESSGNKVRASSDESLQSDIEETGELIAPELMFPELHLKR